MRVLGRWSSCPCRGALLVRGSGVLIVLVPVRAEGRAAKLDPEVQAIPRDGARWGTGLGCWGVVVLGSGDW